MNFSINIRASEIGDLRKFRIKTYIEKWYIQEAYKRLEHKVIKYSEIIRVSPRAIKVKNYNPSYKDHKQWLKLNGAELIR